MQTKAALLTGLQNEFNRAGSTMHVELYKQKKREIMELPDDVPTPAPAQAGEKYVDFVFLKELLGKLGVAVRTSIKQNRADVESRIDALESRIDALNGRDPPR